MTWTWGNDPAGTPRDRVRTLLGDIDTNRQLVTDEQIAWALTDGQNAYGAAAILAAVIANDLAAGQVTVGDMSQSGPRSAADWDALAAQLRSYANVIGSPPSAHFGGVSVARKQTVAGDTDRVRPRFVVDQFTRSSTRFSGSTEPC